jgi:hypothetical protein
LSFGEFTSAKEFITEGMSEGVTGWGQGGIQHGWSGGDLLLRMVETPSRFLFFLLLACLNRIKVGRRGGVKETFPVLHTRNGSKDSKWWSSALVILSKLEGYTWSCPATCNH